MRCSRRNDIRRSDLAAGILAERSPEDIAARCAAVSARLPSPEDISRSRPGRWPIGDDRGREKKRPPARGDDRRPVRGPSRENHRRVMHAEGSVWFRAAIGRRKNAEARCCCRDFAAWRHRQARHRRHPHHGHTPIRKISERVAESFAVKVRRPDKEDNIRIEPLAEAPSGAGAFGEAAAHASE